MSHTCSTALVRCMDFRLGEPIRDFMNREFLYGNTDIIAIAGAARDVSQSDNSAVEQQIDLSVQLHQIQNLVLMNHTDCGAYGGRPSFESHDAERTQHLADMQAAKAKLQAKYPELNIRLVLADIEDNGSIVIADVE